MTIRECTSISALKPLACLFLGAGMGDVLTLVEKAESMVKEEEAAALTKKMLTGRSFWQL